MPVILEPKATVPVTSAQPDALSKDLSEFAGRLAQASSVAKAHEGETFAAYNWATALTAMKSLRNFVAWVDASRSSAEIGKPIPVGQLKPRSAAKLRSVEEVEQELEAFRAKIKKKKP